MAAASRALIGGGAREAGPEGGFMMEEGAGPAAFRTLIGGGAREAGPAGLSGLSPRELLTFGSATRRL